MLYTFSSQKWQIFVAVVVVVVIDVVLRYWGKTCSTWTDSRKVEKEGGTSSVMGQVLVTSLTIHTDVWTEIFFCSRKFTQVVLPLLLNKLSYTQETVSLRTIWYCHYYRHYFSGYYLNENLNKYITEHNTIYKTFIIK